MSQPGPIPLRFYGFVKPPDIYRDGGTITMQCRFSDDTIREICVDFRIGTKLSDSSGQWWEGYPGNPGSFIFATDEDEMKQQIMTRLAEDIQQQASILAQLMRTVR